MCLFYMPVKSKSIYSSDMKWQEIFFNNCFWYLKDAVKALITLMTVTSGTFDTGIF